ncbi:MAG: helix-turn-helix domain-containing protein [Chloroflexota bacterium]
MDELGTLLREAREARAVTLAEAQEATKINSRYLEALEDGRYDVLPSEVHVRGYLRNYARYLHLDPKPLLDRYALNREGRRQAPAEPETDEDLSALGPLDAPEEQVFFDPVNVNVGGGRRSDSGSGLRIIIILALIVSIVIVAIRFVPMLTGNGDSNENLTSGIQEMVSGLANDQQAAAEATAEQAAIATPASVITSTSRNAGIVLPTPTATRPTLPATMETIQMRLDITERTWMRVTIDGEVVFEGLARKGDEPYVWEALQEAQLLTGNAIGIFVTINDVPLGKLGGRGEVVDETWNTTVSG